MYAERALGVKLATRDDWLKIDGPPERVAVAEALFGFLDRPELGPTGLDL